LAADCDPIGVHCGFPFPSDVYLLDDPDESSPSGKSIRFGATTLPKIFGRAPIDPADFYELDGWSVASSPVTYMVGATATGLADPTMLASTVDPSSPTILLNADTGELVPHFTDVDVSTATIEKALLIRPGYVLENSTRYIVAIREVVDEAGEPLEPTDVFRALRDGAEHQDPSVASRRQHYDDIFALLSEAGVERDDLQIAWDFTTGSREGITGGMVAIRDAALAVVGDDGPEYVIKEVVDDPNPMLRHRVILTATVPNYPSKFIHEPGDPTPRLLFDESGAPMQNGTMPMEVLVQIPNSIDNGTPHGVLQNGHGFFGSKNEGRNGYQAMAANGWDWINVAVDLFGLSSADEDLAARAAEREGVRFCESTVSICSVEEVSSATSVPMWFQLYVMRDRGYAAELMARAHDAGCSALVLTVDLAVVGARYRDTRNGMSDDTPTSKRLVRAWDILSHPGWVLDVALRGKPLTFGNLEAAVPGARDPAQFKDWIDSQFDPSVTWDDLAWVRKHWPGKLVLKGILDPEDAKEAANVGADAIVVSNHGGRQLDDVRSTASALPRVKEVVGDRLELLVDGGIHSGLDVVKMLALGANACLLGRAWAYAVAGGGEAGVAHVLRIIREEMNVAMALTGNTRLDQLGPEVLDLG
jgi:L-lactate dehydrogenase (cytochrome)